MRFLKLSIFIPILLGAALLAGCRASTPAPRQTPQVSTAPVAATTAAMQPTLPAAVTATAAAPRTLVLCLQDEPQSLYLYGSSARSTWDVLEAIYDGPFDTRDYTTQPVILQKIPSLTDGEAAFQPVSVKAGDAVVDADGNLVALKEGTKVLPSGCSDLGCAQSWDGKSELSLDQLVVKFKLLDGLKWSDGSPLTAEDSVFSYQIASDPATPASRYLSDRTAAYQALDTTTVEWRGLPGFFDQQFGSFFWSPLPKHTLGSKSAKDLLTDASTNRSPLGWGPYVLQEWTAGDHITLRKNPNYFRAAEGLPKFDTLVYRFVGETADANLSSLLSGECDALDQNPQFLEMFPSLVQQQTAKKIQLYLGQGPEWEHLDFGIQPASYADGYNPGSGDRPDLFGDPRTRQAFAYCIDRASIVSQLLYDRAAVPNSFLPPNHPLYLKDLPGYAFDPQKGQQLLDEVGWKDTDNNPDTPRVAVGIKGVPEGTPLSVTYLTTQAKLRQAVAEAVSGSLRKSCGIGTTVKSMNPGELFSPGPDGPVFGRSFDLVQFSWQASSQPNCLLYSTAQIPDSSNHWIGANITGYSNPAFDTACAGAYWARAGAADYAQRNQQVQAIFANDLPVIPLYTDLKIAIARPDLCGLTMDVTARSIFWNLEGLNFGSCP